MHELYRTYGRCPHRPHKRELRQNIRSAHDYRGRRSPYMASWKLQDRCTQTVTWALRNTCTAANFELGATVDWPGPLRKVEGGGGEGLIPSLSTVWFKVVLWPLGTGWEWYAAPESGARFAGNAPVSHER